MTGKIESYYDDFLSSRMLGYRIHGNKRIELAFKTVSKYLEPGISVADIGCGIGIVTEKIAKFDNSINVIGVDLSKKNIQYANLTINCANARFSHSDFTKPQASDNSLGKNKYQIITLIDVIEHFPEEQRPNVFKKLGDLASENAKLVLTYPSPEYQEYLREHEPEELQIVDNTISAIKLISEAAQAGWQLTQFSYVGVWKTNQYIHAVFSKQEAQKLDPIEDHFAISQFLRRLRNLIFLPLNKRKYISSPLRKLP